MPFSEGEIDAWLSQIDRVKKHLLDFEKKRLERVTQGTNHHQSENDLVEIDRVRRWIYAFASFSVLKSLAEKMIPFNSDVFEIIFQRSPDWLKDWAEFLLEIRPQTIEFVRKKILAEEIPSLDTEAYYFAIIASFGIGQRLSPLLVADQKLLKEDFYKLFEMRGEKDFSFAGRDKYSPREFTWTQAISELLSHNQICRDSLIYQLLNSLSLDFSSFHAN